MRAFERTGRCMILGMCHLLVNCLGAVLDPYERPVAGVFAACMFSVAATMLLVIAGVLTYRGAVNCLTAIPLGIMYVAALTGVLWCSNTGIFGFNIAGDIGTVFLVLVYFEFLPESGYVPLKRKDTELYDPRVTDTEGNNLSY